MKGDDSGLLLALRAEQRASGRADPPTFLLALTADFKKHGASAIEKVRKQQPAAYMKICALLVPREMRVEHTGGVKSMTDEQLEAGIEAITAMLAAKDAGANAKVIEGEVEPVPAPPKTKRKRRKTDGEMVTSMGNEPDTSNS